MQQIPTRSTESPFRVYDFLIVFAITIGVSFFGVIIAFIISPPESLDVTGILSDPTFLGISLASQWIGSIAGLFVLKAIRRASIEDFGLPITGADAKGILWGLGAVGGLIVFGLIVEASGIDAPSQDLVASFESIQGPLWTAAAVLGVGVVGPLTEELIYRGVLQGSLARRFAPMPTIVITSLIFAAVHIQGGNFLTVLFVLLGPIFLLSLVLGWLVETDDGRIGRAFFMHATYNSIQVVLLFSGIVEG